MRTRTSRDAITARVGATDGDVAESPEPSRDAAATLAPLALRAADAAKSLGISQRLLWSLTHAGHIPHVRIGKSIRYPVAALEKWLANRARGGKSAKREK